jgi:hypothetical protein
MMNVTTLLPTFPQYFMHLLAPHLFLQKATTIDTTHTNNKPQNFVIIYAHIHNTKSSKLFSMFSSFHVRKPLSAVAPKAPMRRGSISLFLNKTLVCFW